MILGCISEACSFEKEEPHKNELLSFNIFKIWVFARNSILYVWSLFPSVEFLLVQQNTRAEWSSKFRSTFFVDWWNTRDNIYSRCPLSCL